MKRIILLLVFISILSCSNKSVQLPETKNATITEIKDISAAYLFYDETQKDSVELNRKNLISTTNWLINVDKRLTLKQAIPSIIFLQNKKRNAEMHKNEDAKNYFSCSNPDIQNLAFIEFTDVVYHMVSSDEYFNNSDNQLKIKFDQFININFHSLDLITIEFFTKGCSLIQTSNIDKLLKDVMLDTINDGKIIIQMDFNQNLTFQDYINIKSLFLQFELINVDFLKDEFIHN